MATIPLLFVVYSSFQLSTPDWLGLWSNRLPRLLWNTLRLAFLVAIVCFVIGVSSAWLIARRDFPGRKLAIWLMGTLARNVAKLDAEIRSGRFSPQMGMELAGKTLGIIGFGAIGKRVAKIAGLGLDLKVIAADMIELNSAEIGKLKKDFGIKNIQMM